LGGCGIEPLNGYSGVLNSRIKVIVTCMLT
jgi:hypothetical protein